MNTTAPVDKSALNPLALNQLLLTAKIASLEAIRYTPAGLPALNCTLEHESELDFDLAGTSQKRQVKVVLNAVAFASNAERLKVQTLGSQWNFKGFMAAGRNGKGVVFHIQEFLQN